VEIIAQFAIGALIVFCLLLALAALFGGRKGPK
jgi:hypothetical protein